MKTKRILAFICLLALLLTGCADKTDPAQTTTQGGGRDPEKTGTYYLQEECRYSGENLSERRVYHYDDNCDVTTIDVLAGDGSSKGTIAYSYKETATMRTVTTVSTRTDGADAGRTESVYFTDGTLIERKVYTDGVLSASLRYSYDKQGNLLNTAEFAANGSLRYKVDYAYDENGRRITATRTRSDNNFTGEGENLTGGTVDQITRYTYDEQGNCVDEQVYAVNAQGKENLSGYYKNSYDAQGNRTVRTQHAADGTLLAKITYTYLFVED